MISSPAVSRMLILAVVVVCCGAGYIRADILYVDDDAPAGGDGLSWGTAYVDLQDALDDASTNGAVNEVRVAGGVYKPDRGTGNRYATFLLLDHVAIKGGYAGYGTAEPGARDVSEYETILSGDIDNNDIEHLAEGIACLAIGSDTPTEECLVFDVDSDGDVDTLDLGIAYNSYHVTNASGTNVSASLEGVTITAGRGDSGDGAGGMTNNGGSPTLVACTFRANFSYYYGGALVNRDASPVLTDCVFDRNCCYNHSGGGVYNSSSSAIMTGCRFVGNRAHSSAGILSHDSNVFVAQCVFADNDACGVGNNGGTFTAIDSQFTGNVGSYGGGLSNHECDVVLTNCLFNENRAHNDGGATYSSNATVTITNCTLVGNRARYGAAIRNVSNATMQVTNSVFWNNVASDAYGEPIETSGGNLSINHSCVRTPYSLLGIGNVESPPLFVNSFGRDGIRGTEDDDLRLMPASPCIDAGDNDADTDISSNGIQNLPSTDLAGKSRFVDYQGVFDTGSGTPPIVDMGAYEYQDDCNENGTPDVDELAFGTSEDCNSNAMPDECDIASAILPDEDGDGVPDYCGDQIRYVDGNAAPGGDGIGWDSAYSDLQDALAEASMDQTIAEVRVAGGVYRPDGGSGDRSASFYLVSRLSIKGGYAGVGASDPDARDIVANETVLSGDIDGNDIEALAEGIACVNFEDEPVRPECQIFDVDSNGDVEAEDLGMAGNSYSVVVADGVDDTAILDGVAVAGGYSDLSHSSGRGGGLRCVYSNPAIIDCSFRTNMCKILYGGGIRCVSGSPSLTNCRFEHNLSSNYFGGGLFADAYSDVYLQGCYFTGNMAPYGGGLAAYDSTVRMTDCTFDDNGMEGTEGGGCYCYRGEVLATACRWVENRGFYGAGLQSAYADVRLTGCEFSGNIVSSEDSKRADGGGINHHTGLLSMVDCTFFGNVAELGGGVQTTNCTVVAANCLFSGNRATTLYGAGMSVSSFGTNRCTLTNCTFYRNSNDASASTTLGSGLASAGGISLTVTNCIFRENGSSDLDQIYGGEFLDFSYNNIQGLDYYAGNNNIDVDPEFVDPLGADGLVGTADDNLRLLPTSPCADAGDNEADTDLAAKSVEPLPDTDLDGNPRFVDTPRWDTGNAGETGLAVVDMGAYEIQEVGDCNGNGVSDDEDIARGTSENCNTNAYPDECELAGNDCNESGVPDDCELIGNDCNGNGVPDDCELAGNDCNSDGVPDECELEGNDCNGTGIPDDCELDGNDCNANGSPDECEYAELILPGSGPVDVMACSNGVITFSVAAGESASSFQWYKDDHSNPLSDMYGKIEGSQDSTLRILDIEDADEGVYFCEVADGCIVRVSGEAELSIVVRPIVRSWAGDATVCEGGSVVLSITHDGLADFTYEYVWRKDGVALTNQPRFRILNISDASVGDDGLYTCEVVNHQCGMSELSPEMDVHVRGAVFVEQPATQCHQSGETAVFDMAVEYENPISGYVWQRWYGSPYNRWINLGAPAAGEIMPLEVTAADDGLYRGGVYLDNACWSYSETAVLHVGDATGDLDGDGDIDLLDMARFTECFGQDSDVEPRCSCADFDWATTVIDLDDWSAMEAEVTGP